MYSQLKSKAGSDTKYIIPGGGQEFNETLTDAIRVQLLSRALIPMIQEINSCERALVCVCWRYKLVAIYNESESFADLSTSFRDESKYFAL
jgi:hypothetical protein